MRERVEQRAWMIVVGCVKGEAELIHRCLLRGWHPCSLSRDELPRHAAAATMHVRDIAQFLRELLLGGLIRCMSCEE